MPLSAQDVFCLHDGDCHVDGHTVSRVSLLKAEAKSISFAGQVVAAVEGAAGYYEKLPLQPGLHRMQIARSVNLAHMPEWAGFHEHGTTLHLADVASITQHHGAAVHLRFIEQTALPFKILDQASALVSGTKLVQDDEGRFQDTAEEQWLIAPVFNHGTHLSRFKPGMVYSSTDVFAGHSLEGYSGIPVAYREMTPIEAFHEALQIEVMDVRNPAGQWSTLMVQGKVLSEGPLSGQNLCWILPPDEQRALLGAMETVPDRALIRFEALPDEVQDTIRHGNLGAPAIACRNQVRELLVSGTVLELGQVRQTAHPQYDLHNPVTVQVLTGISPLLSATPR